MPRFRFGSINSWLDDDIKTYQTLEEAWRCWYPQTANITQFLYVYEDEQLILALDISVKAHKTFKELLEQNRLTSWSVLHIEASKDLLKEHGIKE